MKSTRARKRDTGAVLAGIFALATLGACASIDTPPNTRVDDGVKDFIGVEELAEVDAIRRRTDLRLQDLSDYYVIAKDRRESYLISFRSRYRDIPDRDVTPDYRHEGNTIRAKFDTLRGCKISAIYALSEAQADELIGLGDSAGQ